MTSEQLHIKIRELQDKYKECHGFMRNSENAREFKAYRQGLEEINDEIFELEQQLFRLENDEEDI